MKLLLCITGLLVSIHGRFGSSLDTYIVIRHDKSDPEYIELGKKFPAVCKVGKRGGDGTLIAPTWIVTAAHVAEGMFQREGSGLRIYFENHRDGIPIENVFLHPDFEPMRGADIALIQLKDDAASIKPAQLYTAKNEQGKSIVLVGHGDFKTGNGGEWKSDGIKRAATNIIDQVTGDKIIFDFDEPAFATELEGTAGRGDSGGPAFILVNDVAHVAGISSAGMPGKNGPGTYGALEHYTRVSSYASWIRQTIENPASAKSLLQNSNAIKSTPRGDTPWPGLGLFLREQNNRIEIGGKADPLVPEAFRNVLFRAPSFIESLNGKSYTSLKNFEEDFGRIKKGERFTIQFNITGELKTFEAKKM